MASQQFSVDGLHCQGCAKTVTDALMKLSAVTLVVVAVRSWFFAAASPAGAREFGQHRVVRREFVVGVITVGAAVCAVRLAPITLRPLRDQYNDHDDHRHFA